MTEAAPTAADNLTQHAGIRHQHHHNTTHINHINNNNNNNTIAKPTMDKASLANTNTNTNNTDGQDAERLIEDLSVKVFISSPTTACPDNFALQLDLNTTIAKVKYSLSTLLASRPPVEDQRIIFRGRILDNADTIQQTFDKVDNKQAQTFFLVVKPDSRPLPLPSTPSTPTTVASPAVASTTAPSSPSPLQFSAEGGVATEGRTTTTITSTTMVGLDTKSDDHPTSGKPVAAERAPSSLTAAAASQGGSGTGVSEASKEKTIGSMSSSSNTSDLASNPTNPKGTAPGDNTSNPALSHTHTTLPSLSAHAIAYLNNNNVHNSSNNNNAFSAIPSYQYVLVNGMPYLMPAHFFGATVIPLQHTYPAYTSSSDPAMQSALAAAMMTGYNAAISAALAAAADPQVSTVAGTNATATAAAPQQPAVPIAAQPELNARELAQQRAARYERRAGPLWLVIKLAFGVYLFSQNGSIERIVLLYLAALVIFLHQTGRLRLVRRIPPAQGAGAQPAAPAAAAGAGAQGPAGNNDNAQGALAVGESGSTDTTAQGQQQTNNGRDEKNDGDVGSSSSGGGIGVGSTDGSIEATDATTSASTTATVTTTSAQESEAQQQLQQPAQHSTWRNVEHALLTFVSSLVPAPAPDIDPAMAEAAGAGERAM